MNDIFTLQVISASIGSWISDKLDSVANAIAESISHFFYTIVYKIAAAICGIVEILDQLFSTMSGTSYVTYDGSKVFLINVFFNNSTVNNIYWAMALIGIILCFVFAIIAVMRKSIDSGDKIRQSMGGILTGLFKSILLIVSMNALMTVLLYGSNMLLTQVDYVFRNADSLNKSTSIEYTDEQYAAMARALNTIGNYSLSPSYESRYNINSCYNEIRDDLYFLEQTGVFDFQYDTKEGESWQSTLQAIANSADLTSDLSMDVYNEGVENAIKNAVKQLQTNSNFYPLESYTYQYQSFEEGYEYLTLDRVVFLLCTFGAAKNPSLNEDMSLTDSLRGAYYYGQKSIYDFNAVDADFDITEISYILMFALCWFIGWNLAIIIMNCVARIFNLLLLYLISPLAVSTMPLDDGTKTKQWATALIIQCFGILGTVISMRVLITILPIIMSSKLVLFESDTLNLMGKVILIVGAVDVAKKANGMITGILADNASMQSIMAGDMADSARKRVGEAVSIPGMALSGLNKIGTLGKTAANAINSVELRKQQMQAKDKKSLPNKAASASSGKNSGTSSGGSGGGNGGSSGASSGSSGAIPSSASRGAYGASSAGSGAAGQVQNGSRSGAVNASMASAVRRTQNMSSQANRGNASAAADQRPGGAQSLPESQPGQISDAMAQSVRSSVENQPHDSQLSQADEAANQAVQHARQYDSDHSIIGNIPQAYEGRGGQAASSGNESSSWSGQHSDALNGAAQVRQNNDNLSQAVSSLLADQSNSAEIPRSNRQPPPGRNQ